MLSSLWNTYYFFSTIIRSRARIFLNFHVLFGTFFWGPPNKAQNGPIIFGSIFPVFVFQKWGGLDLSADLMIKIQGDLSVMELPFSRIGICYSTFQKWGLWTVAIFTWLWSMSNEKNDMWPHKRLLNTKKSFKVQRGVYNI